jgi:PHD/YefM family antitoxin component YafN of YafNO toxin-antitoxin module
MQPLLTEKDVHFVVSKKGHKRAVQISYKKYIAIKEELERYAYFESLEVQERIRKSDEDLEADRYARFSGKNIGKALEWLND